MSGPEVSELEWGEMKATVKTLVSVVRELGDGLKDLVKAQSEQTVMITKFEAMRAEDHRRQDRIELKIKDLYGKTDKMRDTVKSTEIIAGGATKLVWLAVSAMLVGFASLIFALLKG